MRLQQRPTRKQIASIRFVTDHAYASPILLGITGINE